jgi:hypothetical protein
VEVQLLHEMHSMGIDGVHADVEDSRHFLVRLAFSEQLKNFLLAFGEQLVGVL